MPSRVIVPGQTGRVISFFGIFCPNRTALKTYCTFCQHLRHVLPNFRARFEVTMFYSPATGPPAAAQNEYTKLLMQKAAVVLLLSTTVSKIKH